VGTAEAASDGAGVDDSGTGKAAAVGARCRWAMGGRVGNETAASAAAGLATPSAVVADTWDGGPGRSASLCGRAAGAGGGERMPGGEGEGWSASRLDDSLDAIFPTPESATAAPPVVGPRDGGIDRPPFAAVADPGTGAASPPRARGTLARAPDAPPLLAALLPPCIWAKRAAWRRRESARESARATSRAAQRQPSSALGGKK
jgi:hypothetical protein